MNSFVFSKGLNRASHLFAAFVALFYTWFVSLTELQNTGLQFVTPLLIIFVIHTLVGLRWFGLKPNVSLWVGRQAFKTTLLMFFGVLIFTLLIPDPAHGNTVPELLEMAYSVLVCLAMVIVVCLIVGLILYYVLKLLGVLYRYVFKRNTNGKNTNSKNLEVASLLLSISLLLIGSFEGVRGAYSFAKTTSASASQHINADSALVWQTLETATQPHFPLPSVLKVFPHPTEVVVDEGTALNARRVVKFKGREGEGFLKLHVVERTADYVTFYVRSDTSPIARWVAHQSITYRLEEQGMGTRLTVVLDYTGRLAPAWFFDVLIGGATFLAMDVLARDVKKRAERRSVLAYQI